MITRRADHIYMVINAGCFDKDMVHLRAQLAAFNAKGGDCAIHVLGDRALIAVQARQHAQCTRVSG